MTDFQPPITARGLLGLGNVDNTSDAGKPVSTAQATALALKADLSVALTKASNLAGLADKSVALANLGVSAVLVPGSNLFDRTNPGIISPMILNGLTGAMTSSTGSVGITHLIDGIAGQTYVRSGWGGAGAVSFYNDAGTFVSGVASAPASFTMPVGASKMRFQYATASIGTTQLEIGSVATAYAAFGPVVEGAKVKTGSIPGTALAPGAVNEFNLPFFGPGKNLFDKAAADFAPGKYVNPADGTLITHGSAAYATTGFIPVENKAYSRSPGQTYWGLAYYDANKTFLRGFSTSNLLTFTPEADVAFIRTSMDTPNVNTYQVEEGAAPTSYEAFANIIQQKYLPTASGGVDTISVANPYQPEKLRKTHYKIAKRMLPVPEPDQLSILLAGDSWTHFPGHYSQTLAEYLISKFGDAGGGWCGFGGTSPGTGPWTTGTQPAYLNGNVRPALYPVKMFGAVTDIYNGVASPDLACAVFDGAGEAVTVGIPAAPVHNNCILVFIGTADGVIRYSWDAGAAWTTVNVQGSVGNTQTMALNIGIPTGAGTLRIEHVSGTAKLCGVNLKSAASGVVVHKCGGTGSRITQWTAVSAAQQQAAFAALAPDLISYMDGTNSQMANMSALTWADNLGTLVGRFRAAMPGVDVLIATPPENQLGNSSYPMKFYAPQARALASSLRFTFTDMQGAFGDADNPTEYGNTGAVPLMGADKVHPLSASGGRLLLAEFLRCFLI
jgi:hypothetical protein